MHLLKSFRFTHIKNSHLITKSLLNNFYGNVKPSRNKFNYNQEQQKETRNKRQYQQPMNIYKKVDSTYWQKLLPTIESHAAKVIKLLISPQSSKKQIIRQLQIYLQFSNLTFTPNVRTDLGCLAVLVAMNNSTFDVNFEEYENRIIDFVTLTDIVHSPYDSNMMRCFVMGIHKRIGMNIQKNIRQYYRLKLVQLTLQNFQKVQDQDLIQITTVIQDCLQKDKGNAITKWRFYPFVQAIQSRIMKVMSQYLETSDNEKLQQTSCLIIPSFMYKFLHIIYTYNHFSQEHSNIYYNFLVKRDKFKKEDHRNILNFINALCYTPYSEVKDQNNNLTTLRKKLLQYFQQRYSVSPYYRRSWNDFNFHAKRYTLQRFFQDQFHSVFKSLPFKIVNQKYLVLDKQSLVMPKIPDFIWKLFKQNEKLYLEKYILNDIIKNFYPEKISISREQIATPVTRSATYSNDNEANLKIWQALDALGYNYKKEQNRSQRYVDLIIDQKVIIQVDGQGHYSYLTNEVAPDTSFRNLHLLLSGYKLIIISMYEYNNNRSLQQFTKLVKQKIDIAHQQNVVYVC